MWGEHKKTPESRNKGDKAPYFTTVRKKIDKMNRDEWRAWYKECLETIMQDEALWKWLVRDMQHVPKPQILRTSKQGRQSNRVEQDLPDTRNTNHET